MTTPVVDDDIRQARLSRFFNAVIDGQKPVTTATNGRLFIEAICSQPDPAACVSKILTSTSGLSALQISVRFDTSVSFLNNHGSKLLLYLQEESLRTIGSGSALSKILLQVVEPPYFWDSYTKAFQEGSLDLVAFSSYAWLLLQLISLPGDWASVHPQLVRNPDIVDKILASSDNDTRRIGYKIQHSLQLNPDQNSPDAVAQPGGRHDNDHTDYRQISIMPTRDELISRERAFFRTADFLDDPENLLSRSIFHIDNQFRLLREDMLGEIREELANIQGRKSGYHKGTIIDNLKMCGVQVDTERQPWGVRLQWDGILPQLKKLPVNKRVDFLKYNRHILRHGNLCCLMIDNEPTAFPTISRDDDQLIKDPSSIVVQFADESELSSTLFKAKTASNIKLIQLDTAIFAFEPFLRRLQGIIDLPLEDDLVNWEAGDEIGGSSFQPSNILQGLENSAGKELKHLLGARKSVVLDESQVASLVSCLSQRVSLVQGPPGTGKTFLGALAGKVLYDATKAVILVMCFTNHALDSFLEDLMKVGIPASDIVRLGAKGTPQTLPLRIRDQPAGKLRPPQWAEITRLKLKLADHEERIKDAFQQYDHANIAKKQIMEFSEFAAEDLPFYETFTLPDVEKGVTHVGPNGKPISGFYLLDRWMRGEPDAGKFRDAQPEDSLPVWEMTRDMRNACMQRWRRSILGDLISAICESGKAFNADQMELTRILAERDANVIKTKRVIGCTTNGAASYFSAIQAASPGVVLVEEAGEILESHILTALGPQTQQLILIGDHKQLRPKCSWPLSVEQGDGFDLNRSLFERLILRGFPHVTLEQQHRMRPEFSKMIRELTYPNLKDAPSTKNRADLRGFTDNFIFLNHAHPELELEKSKEARDGNSPSRENYFEAHMILKCVRYLAQQGYGSDKLVVLTPYLGQLRLLRNQLAEENDPILNDLDSFDLVKAGLVVDTASRSTKPSLRLSTIDNYQGEESDIVLVSLTRSNSSGDVGFMSAPERLNVLLSRARDGLIMIGNSDTFINARKGQELWRKAFSMLKEEGHVYNGFPTKCEKHPDRKATLSSPEEFELRCPDGGCTEPCGASLSCGKHKCPSSCHQIVDHSKMKCQAREQKMCSQGHKISWYCTEGEPKSCHACERSRKEAERKTQKAVAEQAKQEQDARKHQEAVRKYDEQIQQLADGVKRQRLEAQRAAIIKQKEKDLTNAKERAREASTSAPVEEAAPVNPADPLPISIPGSWPASQKQANPPAAPKSTPQSRTLLHNSINAAITHNASPSKTEWQRQKDQLNAVNPAIDEIMDMIGLEEVKSQVLRIKAKVDTSIRQSTDLKKERFGLVLLGNSGTGKTTVARHYAKALTSLQVLSGDHFIETTGSRLSHGGVTEVKEHLKQLENAGGGVYFIDEAYQLTENHNIGGKPVLDYLLAEIENLVGQVIFVFAGYRKQMEKFFEHNPGLPSRIPYTLYFDDYTDAELLIMLQSKILRFYKDGGGMAIEDGPGGLFMRIVVTRLGRGRGRDGFGNARALENLFAQIRERQSERLTRERRDGHNPDDRLITKEDLIGPDPSQAILKCDAWGELQKLTGLKAVKSSVSFFIDLVKMNYNRELQEKPLIAISLNRVFLGSPGTGKTTVAKLYGRILGDLGLLSNGEVILKNPADFLGSHIGQSEANTKGILATTVGKVLVIDEAYMLSSSKDNGGDIYKTAVIDTIVAEVQGVPGDDRCVLLLGYEEEMKEMFQNVNQGLTRRFQLSEAFRFEDFTDPELQEILLFKLNKQGLGASTRAISVAIDVLGRARNGLNFGNGGDVENLISKAKTNYQRRQSASPADQRSIDFLFEPEDFDVDYQRTLASAGTNIQSLFQDVIGCQEIVSKLDGYIKTANGMRAQDLDPRGQIPMNFIFKGPPGTGKTSTARKFGQVFYDLGFLSVPEVVECSASDLVGQYVGHTGPKVIKQLEKGLGKVLFIDEAYRLGEGHFAQEAVNELVDCVTKLKFAGKMVIILAGYDKDMNNLLRVNEGLSSRFADEFIFPALDPANCLLLLESRLKQSQITMPSLSSTNTHDELLALITELSHLPAWGSARDVQTLAKSMVRTVYQNNTSKVSQLILPHDTALSCIQTMLSDRRARSKVASLPATVRPSQPPPMHAPPPSQPISSPSTTTSSTSKTAPSPAQYKEENPPSTVSPPVDPTRDPGVSDAVWEQLQRDHKIAEAEAQAIQQRLQEHAEACKLAEAAEKQAEADMKALQEEQIKQEHALQLMRQREEVRIREIAGRDEEAQRQRDVITAALQKAQAEQEARSLEHMRRREEARIRASQERENRERIQRDMERHREAEDQRRKKEQQAQVKLRHMGVCVAGYVWRKQSGGYRCAGGSHFVSDGALGL
ncbi:NFX1-type zinc finger-containing protein [Lachnellula occidentalis]|uniref:NFX1-type zinc finger-containing protein n=1 Tax=Lachnellula occidentalis TaxID=215460 RepID=A0A8H8RXQ8_9HELO|nr:NFX1-type zinc finger-containing protein [Lachnellula occidentalis]